MMKVKAKGYAMYLRTAIKNKWNVAVQGTHGNGKTEIAIQVATELFGAAHIKMFNGATMDEHLDMRGIPVADKKKENLIFLMGPWYRTCKVLILDDFSRAPKGVRNALMEAIQFRTINGQPIPLLESVIVTLNPFDTQGTYDVERMDPAQMDRFQFKMELDPEPDLDYFQTNFGDDNGAQAIAWWKSLDKEVKKLVSSRNLFNAMKAIEVGMLDKEMALPIEGLLPPQSNPHHLRQKLTRKDTVSVVTDLLKTKNYEAIRQKFLSMDVVTECKDWLNDNAELVWEEELISDGLFERFGVDDYPNILKFHDNNKQKIYDRAMRKFATTPGLSIDNFIEPALRHLNAQFDKSASFYNHDARKDGAQTAQEMLDWVIKKYGN